MKKEKIIYSVLYMLFLLFVFLICYVTVTEGRLLSPDDLVYKGAFKLPDRLTTGDSRWGYGGSALTHYPDGDPNGQDDGYPGSLFGAGHTHHNMVGEMSIPVPLISKNYDDLPKAIQLQLFGDVTGGYLESESQPDKFGGLEYLKKQNEQLTDKLYWSMYKYYDVVQGDYLSHGWAELNLSNPQTVGPWHIGPMSDHWTEYHPKKTADYIFTVPKWWGDKYTGGKYLACGKGYGAGNSGVSHGPSIYVYAPWQNDSVEYGAEIDTQILLMYPPNGDYYSKWSPCDSYNGAVFIDYNNVSTVVFAVSVGKGEIYYGVPREGDCRTNKGYHCDPYSSRLLFYNPDDLVDVTEGRKQYYEPQPYMEISIDDYLLLDCNNTLGAMAIDNNNGIIYIFQQSLGEHPVIHVFKIVSNGSNNVVLKAPVNLRLKTQ